MNDVYPREYMDKLDIWTEFSIEHHFRQLVRECQMANATRTTEETEETEETGISGEIDSLPPFDTIYYEQGEN